MKLQEYQSKTLFTMYQIPIPDGRVADSAEQVKRITNDLGGKAVLKAQVLSGSRGKAGGIRLVNSTEEAEAAARELFLQPINDLEVQKILVEQMISVESEIYFSISNDRVHQKPVLIASAFGGMEIEEISKESPQKIVKQVIDPLLGLRDYQLRDVAINMDLDRKYWQDFGEIIKNLWKVYVDCDATLVEVNPLAITSNGALLALDAKIIMDDNALFRHPSLAEIRDRSSESKEEVEAQKAGLEYITMNGNIGCLVNGAGLAMATLDLVKSMGGEPANFLDIGGGADAQKVETALRIILEDTRVRSVLINVFGGITRCDEVARGMISVLNQMNPQIPLVVRLSGTRAEQALALLKHSTFLTATSLTEAARLAVQKAG